MNNFTVWGCTEEELSLKRDRPKAALLDTGSVMLVTQASIEANSLPPGFVGFLDDEAMSTYRGVSRQVTDAILASCTTWMLFDKDPSSGHGSNR